MSTWGIDYLILARADTLQLDGRPIVVHHLSLWSIKPNANGPGPGFPRAPARSTYRT